MSRLSGAFEKARNEDRAALVIYLCAGDPNLAASEKLMLTAAQAGADILEVGVPFSDPTADGPAIQRASERALKEGTTLRSVLDSIARIRAQSDIPIVLFGYYNPILCYGEDKLVADAVAAGVDAILVVDIPPEQAEPLTQPCRKHGLDYIPLVAPTTTPQRLALVGQAATSFIYYVSMTGVTGAASSDLREAADRARRVGQQLDKPMVLGFGIKQPSDVASVASLVDGVVVGSAAVQAIEQAPNTDAGVEALQQLVAGLRQATNRTN